MINKQCFHLRRSLRNSVEYGAKYVVSCILLILSFVPHAYSQQPTITGTVVDSSNAPLSSASVVLVDDKGLILQFAVTDQKGHFSLVIANKEQLTLAKLRLEVSFIGYTKQRLVLVAQQTVYRFVMVADPHYLKEIVVKSLPPISLSGDTLRYNVAKFAQNTDRNIKDVLRRLPGIEINDDGSIYFNGKKISNLYIDGDDLMSGRYGLATRTIRKELIESIEVISNHQPIKVLQNKMQTDNTAVNLVLKDPNSVKASISGMIGVGLPKQYDANGTLILLNHTFKAINNIGFNNCGVDYKGDFKQLGAANFITDIGDKPTELGLSLGTIGPPDLPLPNYYFNRSRELNLNNLYKSKRGVQIKVNLQEFKDTDSLNYFSKTENYLANDTTRYLQLQSNTNKPTLLAASVNVLINKDKYFVNNSSSIDVSREDNTSVMNFNGDGFCQGLIKHINKFSNDFNFMPLLKWNGIGEVRWLVSYSPNTQLLNIGNGYYSQIPGQTGYYDKVAQHFTEPTFFSHVYASYVIAGKLLSQQYVAGYKIASQELTTQLDFTKDSHTIPYSGDSGNNLNWQKKNLYISAEYQFKYHKWQSTVKLPLGYQHIHYDDEAYNLNTLKNNFLFNPSVQVKYNFNPEQNLNVSYSYNTTFSDLSGVYRGGLLVNYLTFTANDADVQEKMGHLTSVIYNFQKSARMFFMNAGITYDNSTTNAILSTQYLNNIRQIVFVPGRNDMKRISIVGGASKYLFKLKTNVSLKFQWSHYVFTQIVNDILAPSSGNSIVLNAKLQKTISRSLSMAYEPGCVWSNASQLLTDTSKSAAMKNSTFRFDQRLTVIVSPLKRVNMEVACRNSYNSQVNTGSVRYFFMDAKANYSTSKGMDFSFSMTNLFNIKNYSIYSVLPNHLIADQYVIRGRMCILRLNYNF